VNEGPEGKRERNCLPGLGSPVRQAFQPDPAATKSQRVRLESLTYEEQGGTPGKQLRANIAFGGGILNFGHLSRDSGKAADPHYGSALP